MFLKNASYMNYFLPCVGEQEIDFDQFVMLMAPEVMSDTKRPIYGCLWKVCGQDGVSLSLKISRQYEALLSPLKSPI